MPETPPARLHRNQISCHGVYSTLMEQEVLEAVLGGRLPVAQALAWALGAGDEPPPIELRQGSPWRGAPRPQLRPADFRVRCRCRLLPAACCCCHCNSSCSRPAACNPSVPALRRRCTLSTM